MQSHFVWGQAQISSSQTMARLQDNYVAGSDHGEKWEILIEALEARRIRQTIANFPIFEEAFSGQEQSVESRNQDDRISGDLDNESNEVDSQDETLTATSKDHNNLKLQESVVVLSGTKDERYSPSFIMPLILGLLESFADRASIGADKDPSSDTAKSHSSQKQPNSEDIENEDVKDDPDKQNRESFVKIVYRLYQKGAFSLSLSCLSSRCVGVRRLALSTLYFFIQALQMKESQDIAQWRERPQLEMVLNSVQRGLALERAKKLKQLADEGITKYSTKDLIPILPAVSALFLARAALIMSKPSDEMYPSMNRYFLRIQDFHGAYKDCFSVPSFMNLFCSTDNDNNQARRERIWALQLLKDGILDEYSYKAVGRRHIPELLMSSFDGFCCCHHYNHSNGKLTSTFDTECSMILETLQRCLINGGISCHNYLIKNVGLFSWIQTILESHSTKSIIDLKFFEMLLSALKSSSYFMGHSNDYSSDYMPFDAINLSKKVIETYEMKLSPTISSDGSSTKLLSTVCDILSLIHHIHQSLNDDNDFTKMMFKICRYSIPISSATLLMEQVKNHNELQHKIVGALSYFPIEFNNAANSNDTNDNLNIIITYSKMSLEYILNHDFSNHKDIEQLQKDEVKHTFLNIMERIKLFSIECKEVLMYHLEIAELIISCRRKMNFVGLYDIWLQTLLCIVPLDKHEMDVDIENERQSNDDSSSHEEKIKLIRWIVNSELQGKCKGHL